MKFAALTQVALLGTERQSLSLAAAATPLGQLESQIDANQRERALLTLAALSGAHERAGRLPARDLAPRPAVCPGEQLPRASDPAGSLLRRLLGGESEELLPEWLELAAQAGRLAPPEALPALLRAGAVKADLREAVLPVLGERGRWLAGQNSDWSWVGGALDAGEAIWHEGEPPARLFFLQRLRRTQPARARELLAATWKEEPPEERSLFLATFELGLTLEDEPFLEAALDDKRKEVRRTAAALLARLPESALARRAAERAKPLLKFVPGEAAPATKSKEPPPAAIEVTLPAACDKAMQRDGVELKPPPGIGEKAWWLMQTLEAAPLDGWLWEWNTRLAEILTASQSGEWKKELLEAWMRAAIRQRNAAWAEALFEAAVEGKQLDKFEGLLAAMSPAQREARLTALSGQTDPKVRTLAGLLIAQCRHDWSVAFSRAVLAFLRRETAGDAGDWQLRNQIKPLAFRLAPEVLGEAAVGWPTGTKAWEFWSKGVDEFLAVTQLRCDLRAALKP